MYRCEECGNIFEEGEEKHWVEDYGEELAGCPCCCGAYSPVYQCKCCGAYRVEYLNDYCDECRLDAYKTFNYFIESLSLDEREMLKDVDIGEML